MKTTSLVDEIFENELDLTYASNNRMIGTALVASWIGVIVTALCTSAKTWDGGVSSLHPHLRAAIFLGFLVGGVPGLAGILKPESRAVAYLIACGQMLLVGLLTHISGGRIEMHFAYFASLALLASYREWKIVVLASAVAAVDHLLRGLFMPQSIFGTDQAQILRVLEHAFWVVWEDVFLIHACVIGMNQWRRVAKQSHQQQELALSSDAQVKSLFTAAEILSSVSGSLRGSTDTLMAEATASLGQARSVSEQLTVVSGQVAEMGRSSKTIFASVGESSSQASQSDKAASNALIEVNRLMESSEQISEVLDTVQAIVFQTNLLSVNAAIEAARAGEAGASFAVVATEVRQLADQSRQSADVISQRIGAIQKNVQSVSARLSEICSSVTQISHLTTNINESARSQVSTTADITESFAVVKNSTDQMIHSINGVFNLSETAAGAAVRTSELANRLRQLAEKTTPAEQELAA